MKKLIILLPVLLLALYSCCQRSIRVFNRANKFLERCEFAKAEKWYTLAIHLDRFFPEAYYNRGIARSALKQYEQAIQDYSIAIDQEPWMTAAYNNRGADKIKMRDFTGAIDDYTRAIKIDTTFISAYFNRAIAHLHIGQASEALEDLKAYYCRGFARVKAGREQEGNNDISKAKQMGSLINMAELSMLLSVNRR